MRAKIMTVYLYQLGTFFKDIKKNNSDLSKNFINIKDLEKEKLS